MSQKRTHLFNNLHELVDNLLYVYGSVGWQRGAPAGQKIYHADWKGTLKRKKIAKVMNEHKMRPITLLLCSNELLKCSIVIDSTQVTLANNGLGLYADLKTANNEGKLLMLA